jgi:hypothetical protein
MLIGKSADMVLPLCSLRPNPDGSFRPNPYEINAAISHKLALTALGLLVIVLIVGILDYRIRSRESILVVSGLGLILMALHPAWTVSMSGGDCGQLRQDCSWLVLGLMGIFLAISLVLFLWPGSDRDDPDRQDYDDRLPSRVPR